MYQCWKRRITQPKSWQTETPSPSHPSLENIASIPLALIHLYSQRDVLKSHKMSLLVKMCICLYYYFRKLNLLQYLCFPNKNVMFLSCWQTLYLLQFSPDVGISVYFSIFCHPHNSILCHFNPLLFESLLRQRLSASLGTIEQVTILTVIYAFSSLSFPSRLRLNWAPTWNSTHTR